MHVNDRDQACASAKGGIKRESPQQQLLDGGKIIGKGGYTAERTRDSLFQRGPGH